MKNLRCVFIGIFALVATFFAKAQEKEEIENQVFHIVETMPEFPGGQEALKVFIANSIKYPEKAKKEGISGKVYITFVVDKEGNSTNCKVARGVNPLLDKEALRVVSSLPKWKPGEQKGKKVKVKYTVPIAFALEGKEKKEHTNPRMVDGEQVFYIVEEMPEFPGGDLELRKTIAENIEYPVQAQKDSIQGKVYITFIVGKDGNVKKPKIARGVDPLLDKEALRVVSLLPQWKPGKQRDKAVDVSYTVPITFVLK